ncbi:alpha/beta fold hydrolase [Tychonema sp. BBK16]|uniref:alpha/beta fold hydrolase n=1 Tax=Tychonema sp. BBK16 TaxID=2699888 RepID=UPI001F295930|nr:alpha/beta hydrolase [Tychonema sp. BBK16]MCF6373460.1 alpha/beta hydrolase [Tychonema sp. BBK16]
MRFTSDDVLWLSSSPSLQIFDRSLLHYLNQSVPIQIWEYEQTEDEGCSLDVAVELLHHYLKFRDRPIHLIGHSTSGLIGLMYARRYPHKVSSLGLLAVGLPSNINWQAHYYTHLSAFPWSREQILSQMVSDMLGEQNQYVNHRFVSYFEEDLALSPSPNSLFGMSNLKDEGVEVPLLLCSSKTDFVVSPILMRRWLKFLKKGDRLWKCKDGRHFFHHFYPEQVGEEILNFWLSIHSHQPILDLKF